MKDNSTIFHFLQMNDSGNQGGIARIIWDFQSGNWENLARERGPSNTSNR